MEIIIIIIIIQGKPDSDYEIITNKITQTSNDYWIMQKYNSKATFNVKTLNRIGQLQKLTASAIGQNIDIIHIQEQR